MRVCCGGTDGRRMNQTAPGAVVTIKEICRPEIREGLKSPSCRNLSKRGNRDPQTLPGSGDRPDVGSDAARLPGRWHLTYIQPNLPSLVRGDCGHRPSRRLPLKVKNQRRCTRHDADFYFSARAETQRCTLTRRWRAPWLRSRRLQQQLRFGGGLHVDE